MEEGRTDGRRKDGWKDGEGGGGLCRSKLPLITSTLSFCNCVPRPASMLPCSTAAVVVQLEVYSRLQ
jgi:hypothetical protein